MNATSCTHSTETSFTTKSVTRQDQVAQRRKQRQSSARRATETDQKHYLVRVQSVIFVAVAFTVLSRDQQRHLCACNHLVNAFIQRCSQQFSHRWPDPADHCAILQRGRRDSTMIKISGDAPLPIYHEPGTDFGMKVASIQRVLALAGCSPTAKRFRTR